MTVPVELNGIAVVGMAGRFPKALDVEQFWKNLQDGVGTISFFSVQELAECGVPPAVLEQPNYVRAKGVLEDADLFDASFFDFSPREAEVTDPQIRTFLECAWHALENAGCAPETFPGLIGVYAGMSISTYLLHIASQSRSNSLGILRMLLGNDKDHLAPWTSYKLDLRGPSINVQTACSTSLVAIHMACQSLKNFECDAALAGGVSIVVPQKAGHLFEPGGILSSDGHCHAFDRKADGSVSGEGVGVVLLKRLEDAIENRDTVLAVIKGSAVNNDGGKKLGYTAPGVEGQAQVIAMAMAAAEIEPGSLGYVEAHGSGTMLGDPVEIAALAQAFQGGGSRSERVAIGSVKTNVGHLAAAAGVAGFIKTVLAIRDGVLPPSLHFEEPNPRMSLEQTPFYVNTKLSPWLEKNRPRRAGVSSFGLGGTNAHVILEEAPPSSPDVPSRNWHLLLLSAKTETALEQAKKNLADHLHASGARLDDVAFTLRAGRKAFAHRWMAVCRDTEDAINVLENRTHGRLLASAVPEKPGPIVFLLPGVGDHYLDMSRGLYEEEPYYARCVDECFGLLREHLRLDLKEHVFPEEKVRKTLDERVQTPFDLRKAFAEWTKASAPCVQPEILPEMAQLVLFVIEHSLARLFMHWGIRPAAMLGYSLGEYVAACIAGVMSLPEALRLIAGRARLIQNLPTGAMLAVSLPENQTAPLLTSGLSIAGINGPTMCTVAGSIEEIERLEEKLMQNKQAVFRRLNAGHAYHSSLMMPAAADLTEITGLISFKPPQIPYISNVTGTWATPQQANPGYWSMHLCSPVRFQQGVEELCSRMEPVFLEIGPGQMLSSLVEQHVNRRQTERPAIVQSLPHSMDKQSDRAFLLQALGRLWLAGNAPDWNKVSESEACKRVPLPMYPYERRRYWIDGNSNEFLRSGNGASLAEATGTAGYGPAKSIHPRPLSDVEYVAPSTQLEQRLGEILEDILGIRPVGIHDNFFQMGGNSLSGLRLISQLTESFGINLSMQKLFLAPTIAALAPVVEEEILAVIEGMDEAEVP